MNSRIVIRVVISTAVLVGAMWWVFDSADVPLMISLVQASSWGLLLASVPVILTSHLLRASRWQRLLSASSNKPSLKEAFSAVMIGYAANTIVPRSGELLRPFVVSRRRNLPYSTVLSSVVVERMLDVVTLLFGIALLLVVRPDVVRNALPDFSVTSIIVALAVPAGLLGVFLIVFAFTDIGTRLLDKLLRPISAKVATAVATVLANVRIGASVLRQPKHWAPLVAESIGMWMLYIVPLWLVLEAIPWSGDSFTLIDGAILLVITAIGVTIAPTPGALGVYQGFAQIAMVRLYGATPTEGLAFGVLAWLMNFGVALLVGGSLMIVEMRSGLRWSDATRAQEQDSDAT